MEQTHNKLDQFAAELEAVETSLGLGAKVGAAITATGALVIGGGKIRHIGSLGGNIVLTPGATGAAAGDKIALVRTGTTAHTVEIAGLYTMPASETSVVVLEYTGAAWVLFSVYPGGTQATLAGVENLTNKTLVTPTIASMVNAGHNHSNAAGGGLVAATGVAVGTAYQKFRTNSGATATEWADEALLTGAAATMTADDITITVTEPQTHYKVLAPFSANPQSIAIAVTNAQRGWQVWFTADGSLNTQTVTYKTTATAITGALDANKKHTVCATFDGTLWVALASVGP
jgi:plastocyanin